MRDSKLISTTLVRKVKHDVQLQANKFAYFRFSDPYYKQINEKQDRLFPTIEKLSYDNYLVAVNEMSHSSEF